MGLKGVFDKEVNNKIEKQLYLMKDEFSARLSFGGLYGALTNNASPYAITYF